MDNLSNYEGQMNSVGGVFTNWRYDGYNQNFPYIPLTYTAPAQGVVAVGSTLLLLRVG